MENHLKHLLKKYDLVIRYGPTHGEGYIVCTPDGYPNLLVVKENLTDEEAEKVILHEIGHAENDSDVIGDYKTDTRARGSSEHKANSFMISEKIKEYASLGYDIMNVNYINLADSLGTKDYLEVKQELAKYITKKSKTSDCKSVV